MPTYGLLWGFSDGSVVKNPPAKTGDAGSVPGLGRSLGEGNGNPLQYSCLGNLMGRGVWQATVHGVAKELDATWRPNNNNGYFSPFPFKNTHVKEFQCLKIAQVNGI